MRIHNASNARYHGQRPVNQDAIRAGLKQVHWHVNAKGVKVLRGPVGKVHVGTCRVREWGRDVEVQIAAVGEPFEKLGVELVYGYPAQEESEKPHSTV